MNKYQLRPPTCEAIQWLGELGPDFDGLPIAKDPSTHTAYKIADSFLLPGDYIIRWPDGTLSTMRSEMFRALYKEQSPTQDAMFLTGDRMHNAEESWAKRA